MHVGKQKSMKLAFLEHQGISWLQELAYLEKQRGGIVDKVHVYSLVWEEDQITVRGNAVTVSS